MNKHQNLPRLLETAIRIAVEAHRGQKDRYGSPYILHPLRVMCRLESLEEKIVAVLHDVIEDTDWTLAALRREGFSAKLLSALDCVTRRDEESYETFVARASRNRLARAVKIADLRDNMDLRRLRKVTARDMKRLNKYLKAWQFLGQCPS